MAEWVALSAAVAAAAGAATMEGLAGEADAASLDAQREALKEDAKMRAAARSDQTRHQLAQINVGAAAGNVDQASKSVVRQKERVDELSQIEQHADDYVTRYRRERLKSGAKNARIQGYVGGALNLTSSAAQAYMQSGL